MVRKKQRLVLRQAGRKCFLFQSVLYPLVTKKERPERKRVSFLKGRKKFTQPQVQGVPCWCLFTNTLFICLVDGVAGQLTGRLPGHWASSRIKHQTQLTWTASPSFLPPFISSWPLIALPCSVANHGGDFAWSYCNIIYVFAVICHCYCRPHNYFGSVEDVHQVPMCFPNIC